jgi:hypothetical protein
MICKWTKKPCDPKGKYCGYLDRTFKMGRNETCEHIIPNEEAEG